MVQHVASRLNLPVVPFDQWIAEVAKIDDLVANPAGKMLEIYKRKPIGANEKGREAFGIPRAYSDRAVELSSTHRDMSQLGPADYDAWISYWRAHGYLGHGK